MSDSYTRVLPLLLAAALGLAPQLAQAFAFDSAIESSVVLPNQTTGSPVVWAFPQVTMSVHLGSVPPGTTLANGTTSWDTNVAESLALWNTVVPNFFTMDTTEADPCEQRNGVNTVTFAHDHCGDSFGDVAAVTRKSYGQRSGHFFLVEADVVLNANLCWNAYAGPLRPCEAPLSHSPAIDIQRVMLHELGHVLGLEHPDAAGQTVVAVMNSYLSDVDTLMQDDRDGAVFLYSQTPLTAIARASSGSGESGGGGGCTLRPGVGVDPTLGAVLLFLVVCMSRKCKHILVSPRQRTLRSAPEHPGVRWKEPWQDSGSAGIGQAHLAQPLSTWIRDCRSQPARFRLALIPRLWLLARCKRCRVI